MSNFLSKLLLVSTLILTSCGPQLHYEMVPLDNSEGGKCANKCTWKYQSCNEACRKNQAKYEHYYSNDCEAACRENYNLCYKNCGGVVMETWK